MLCTNKPKKFLKITFCAVLLCSIISFSVHKSQAQNTPSNNMPILQKSKISEYAIFAGTAFACIMNEQDKIALKQFQNTVNNLIINMSRTEYEMKSAAEFFVREMRKAYDKRLQQGAGSCPEAMKTFHEKNPLKGAKTMKDGSVMMPDGEIIPYRDKVKE